VSIDSECESCADELERLRRQNRLLGFGFIELVGSLDAASEHGHTIYRPEAWARGLAVKARETLKRVSDVE
jgi:hypothetical protein